MAPRGFVEYADGFLRFVGYQHQFSIARKFNAFRFLTRSGNRTRRPIFYPKCSDLSGRAIFVVAVILGFRSSGRSALRTRFKSREKPVASGRSEEHTSELQSLRHLVCR